MAINKQDNKLKRKRGYLGIRDIKLPQGGSKTFALLYAVKSSRKENCGGFYLKVWDS